MTRVWVLLLGIFMLRKRFENLIFISQCSTWNQFILFHIVKQGPTFFRCGQFLLSYKLL